MGVSLNARQLAFVEAYLVTRNGKQAAIKAGYSPNTAESQASRLLRNAKVAEAIAEGREKIAKRAEVEALDVIRELAQLCRSDIRKAFDGEGRLLPIHQLPDDIARAISAVEVEQLFDGTGEDKFQSGVTVKVKFWDKPRSLELLGKYFKLYVDKVEHSADSSFAELLKEARERAQRR